MLYKCAYMYLRYIIKGYSNQTIHNPIEYTNEEWRQIKFVKDGISLILLSGLVLPVHVLT